MALDDSTEPVGDLSPRALVLEIVLPDAVREVSLPQTGDVVIGRSRAAGVSIDHASISREHARLRLGAAVEIECLGARNGTFVRGTRLTAGQPLQLALGDIVELGTVVVRLALARSDAPSGERRTAGSGRALLDRPEGWYAPSSGAMRDVLDAVDHVAESDVSVLLLGETGVGKEVCAERLHGRSARAPRTLLRLNCTALPESLIESELFGYERGAFTGAAVAKPGLIESADGGTVFLDEIGELPPAVQAKLLRVLDRREVLRVGGLKPRTVDVRFVSATHRALEQEIEAGRFRQDLYYRLAGMVVRIPPLRERVDEIVPLAERFLADAAARRGRRPPGLTAAARRALEHHAWPGNIRELRNAVERALVMCGAGDLDVGHLPLTPPPTAPPRADDHVTARFTRQADLRGEVEQLERERIVAMLDACHGNQSEAARRLGISRGALLARLRAWGLSRG